MLMDQKQASNSIFLTREKKNKKQREVASTKSRGHRWDSSRGRAPGSAQPGLEPVFLFCSRICAGRWRRLTGPASISDLYLTSGPDCMHGPAVTPQEQEGERLLPGCSEKAGLAGPDRRLHVQENGGGVFTPAPAPKGEAAKSHQVQTSNPVRQQQGLPLGESDGGCCWVPVRVADCGQADGP